MGNPNLGEVRGVLVAIENPVRPNGTAISAEMWANELRLSGLDERGGYAALGRVDLVLADLGTLSVSANKYTQGFGSLEQRVNERAKDNLMQFDIAANIDAGKLVPKKARLSVPIYASINRSTLTPEFDPYDLDVNYKQKLNASAPDKRDSIKRAAADITTIKTLNFNNVRVLQGQGRPRLLSLSNFDISYSFTQTEHTSPVITQNKVTRHRGGFGYTYIGQNSFIEPFKKLINQGMILGMSAFVYRVHWSINSEDDFDQSSMPFVFVSKAKRYDEETKSYLQKILDNHFQNRDDIKVRDLVYADIHADLSVINDITNELDIEAFKNHPLYSDYKDAEFILENGKYIVGREVEKMSKSKYNVVNPDDICEQYGADTLRLYEMFLGPLEQAKPWNTAGITGVSGFLKKLWRLYFDDNGLVVTNDEPSADMYKSLHKTIKKVTEDIENFSFNTSVSQFMICVNELAQQKCRHRAILEPLAVLISPYAPHIAEELWNQLGHEGSIATVAFPQFEAKYLVESGKEYPVSFNGKMRFTIKLPLDLSVAEIEAYKDITISYVETLLNSKCSRYILSWFST